MDQSDYPPKSRAAVFFAGAFIVLATWAAYSRSFSGPFVFDDLDSIPNNPTIRHLWPIGPALSPPPGGRTVSGRPVLNLSFAVNQAFDGSTWGYHAVNLAIHALAALTLFGVVRRTLSRSASWSPPGRSVFGSGLPMAAAALPIAFAVALLWAVHPLQTESVTYIVQRAESLMGLFYLWAAYCFIRGAESQSVPEAEGKARFWYASAVAACLLGAGTKEVIVSLPVMLLLYDRTFLAGNFREAWRRRWAVYVALASTWLLLGAIVAANPNRGGTAGLDTKLPSDWRYWATQGPAVIRYLRLAMWPAHQVIDYGFESRWYQQPLSGIPADAAVLGLIVLTAIAVWRRPALGFLGVWFFAILAPTSIVPGIRQTVAEHRMYLALAPVLLFLILGAEAVFASLVGRGRTSSRLILATALAAAAALGWLTTRRNGVYRSDLALCADEVAKRPGNVSALNKLGYDLMDAGRLPEAITLFETALRSGPVNLKIYLNLGQCFERIGRPAEALKWYATALRREPDSPEAHANYGRALGGIGQVKEAVAELERAERLKPDYAEAFNNLGALFLDLGRLPEAQAQFAQAVKLEPDYADALCNLGLALRQADRAAEAVGPLQRSLRLRPDNPIAHFNLGLALVASARLPEAAVEFQQVVRLVPDYPDAHDNLGSALAQLGRVSEAQEQFAAAVRLDPRSAAARHNHGLALQQLGRLPEAIAELREALRLKPNDPALRQDLDDALGQAPPPR